MENAAPDDARRGGLGAALAIGLLSAALVLGGGGSPAPLPELALEVLAALVLTAWLLLPATRNAWRDVPRAVWAVCALILVVPLLQLVPLPPALWQALPGRQIEIETLALIGQAQTWRPWSMAPERTLASLLSLQPPLVLLIIAATLRARQRLWLVLALVAVGLASLLVGALQLSTGPDSPVQFYGVTTQNLRGFQANHNSTSDLLLAALLGWVLAVRGLADRGRLPDAAAPVLGLAGLGIALFGFGIVLTASRMGILLLPLALLAALVLLRSWLPPLRRNQAIAMLVGFGLLALAGVALVRTNPVLSGIGQRFDFSNELRVELWRDGMYVARKHYPVGVGMGDFVPALVADERLEVVRPSVSNRAHNEYVELAVEAGFVGLAAWGVIIFLVMRGAWRARAETGMLRRGEAVFATAVLALLVAHSMVDYPFRSMALACLGALCAAILLIERGPARTRPDGKDRN